MRVSVHLNVRYLALSAAILVGVLLMPATAFADSAVAQGFEAGTSGIVTGALVSLRPSSGSTVELASIKNRAHMVGVAAKQSLIEFANGQPLQVVTSGATPALVSDINGVVKNGDKITASPIAGVGMKATETATVIGSAQVDMQTAIAEARDIVAADGSHRTVHIGAVSLLVSPTYYEAEPAHSKLVPSSLQDFAANLAGRSVSPVRILVAGLVVAMLFVAVAMLLYSSVRSSITAIGRNPLSTPAVHKSLWEVGVTIVGVLAFTTILVYLILTT